MTLDIPTIIFLITIGNFITGLFLFAYSFNKQDRKHKIIFIIAKLLQSIGWVIFMISPQLPWWLVQVFGNTSMLVGIFFEAWAIIVINDEFKGLIRTLYISFLSVAILFFLSIVFWWNTEPRRILFFSVIASFLISGSSIMILYRKTRSPLETAFAILYISAVLIMIFRGANAFFGWVDGSVLSIHPISKVVYTLLFGHMIITNIGFILMSKEKSDAIILEFARIDQLTKISNRHTFLETSNVCINKARENKQPVSLLMFDIDNFKHVNDTHGHMAGDEVLIQVANLIRPLMNECQSVGRFGGDEFAIILPGFNEEASNKKAKEIIDIVNANKFTEHGLSLSISIGVATLLPDANTTFDDFYRLADEGLYLAKKIGKSAFKRTPIKL